MNDKTFRNGFLLVAIASVSVIIGYSIFSNLLSSDQIQRSGGISSQNIPHSDNSSKSLIGKWIVISVNEDDVQIVSDGNGASIEFYEDGAYKASGGCNAMEILTYEIQKNMRISISTGGTKRLCSKDIVEFWDLNNVVTYELSDNTLFLHYKKENGTDGFFKLQMVPLSGTEYNSESWRNIIPVTCDYFSDGCNTCQRTDSRLKCTLIYCNEYRKPECLE